MDQELSNYARRAQAAEDEIKLLIQEVKNIKSGCDTDNKDVSPDLTELLQQRNKLKYRLSILKKAVEEFGIECPFPEDIMPLMQGVLEKLFSDAIEKAFPDVPDPPIDIALSPKFGDYQCNSALPISHLLKGQGIQLPPRAVGNKIVENMSSNPVLEKLEVAGPGFINITLKKEYAVKVLSSLVQNGVKPPPIDKRLRIIVDFSSPNIAKEMHVGHLRSTIIGESICRVLEFLGHDVLRLNHIGDWGTQFGMLIAHLQDKFPNYLTESPPIQDLQTFYKESKKRFDEDPEFKKRAYDCVVKLQNFDPDYKRAWEMICDVSRKEFQKVYDRLDIRLKERGESFYQSRMNSIVKDLESHGFLEEDDGRKVMWGRSSVDTIPLTIVKSDGGYTYDTSDMACIKQRIEEEKGEWLIYVTDLGQGSHFEILQNCSKRTGVLTPNIKVTHVGFGVVLGEDKKKFKTRSGDTVKLAELLDEGLKRALDTLIQKGRDKVLSPEELQVAQESVAYGCIKYSDLSHNRNHEYVFSFDKMLEDKGNTAVYLLYALTRIRSIARTANITPEQLKEAAKTIVISLDHDKEWKLGKVLLRFPDIVLDITRDLCLHRLCEYVYEIATTFTEFYDSCYCIEKDSSGEIKTVHMNRLLLCEAAALIMVQCFSLLGLKPVARM